MYGHGTIPNTNFFDQVFFGGRGCQRFYDLLFLGTTRQLCPCVATDKVDISIGFVLVSMC